MNVPNLGESATVWPAPGLKVQDGAGRYGVFVSGPREVVWDEYWHRRYLDGAVLLHDPAPSSDGPSSPPSKVLVLTPRSAPAAKKE